MIGDDRLLDASRPDQMISLQRRILERQIKLTDERQIKLTDIGVKILIINNKIICNYC